MVAFSHLPFTKSRSQLMFILWSSQIIRGVGLMPLVSKLKSLKLLKIVIYALDGGQ